ncbi:MAG: signal peptidase I [Spirochaetales bacterium]|nr:signal peptidase I [Spirochaetales bacterium]
MDRFLTRLESLTVRYLTHRKAVRLYQKMNKPKRTFLGELKGWADALVFAVFAVLLINQYLFQLFVIPTPSMVSTLDIGDRVFVSKTIYGVELYPTGPKIGSKNRQVRRDAIITFYNPEYDSKGPLFDILSQIIFSGTLSLVNIDRNEDGSIAERLFVKRAVGLPEELVRFVDGNMELRKAGFTSFEDEASFRKDLDLVSSPHRSIDPALYSGLNAWGSLFGYLEEGLDVNNAPTHLKSSYNSVAHLSFPPDYYTFEKARAETRHLLDPTNLGLRSEASHYRRGTYVPKNAILPLGDNRDDSRDGRYFGPVDQSTINGSVVFRFWPPNRVRPMGDA